MSTEPVSKADDLEPIVILDEDMPPALTPAPAILLLRDLVAYAQNRLVAGAGAAALARHGLDAPDIVRAYGIGYRSRPRPGSSAIRRSDDRGPSGLKREKPAESRLFPLDHSAFFFTGIDCARRSAT
jgi:hypothetical protein